MVRQCLSQYAAIPQCSFGRSGQDWPYLEPAKSGLNTIRRTPIVLGEQGIPDMMEDHDRILRIRSVLDRTGLSWATLYRKMQQGTFPRQVAISTRCAGWRESAV